MTYDDEKAIINASKIGSNPIQVLLSNCIKGVDVQDLLEIDRIYLIVKLRDISFGNEYSVKVGCSNCTFDNALTFDISQLNLNFVPDEWTDTVDITLPVAKKKVQVRLPRVKDEEYTSDPIKFADNLWRFVTNIEGHREKNIISKVCDQLPLADRHSIINALNPELGLDPMIKFSCSKCSHVNITVLPIGPDFLSVKS